jgi:opacity protein-like surface antigen
VIVSLATLLVGAGAARAQGGHYAGESVGRIAFGWFEPDGDSAYWQEKEIDFTGSAADFDDVTLSLDYAYFWSDRFAAIISLSGWEGDETQAYLDFVDTSGRDISHLTTLSTGWLEAGLLFHLFAGRRAVMPYLGAGAAVAFWELTEEGEFIDFDASPPSIFADRFFADGETFGYFLLAGLEIPVSATVSLFAEGRWRAADDELDRDFAGFGTLDLSGRSLTGGVSISF